MIPIYEADRLEDLPLFDRPPQAEEDVGAAVDAILLLEGDLGKRCDVTVGILAPVEDRVRRLIAREGITESYARSRIAAQKSDDFYRQNCTFILENNGAQETYARAARDLFQKILNGGIQHE